MGEKIRKVEHWFESSKKMLKYPKNISNNSVSHVHIHTHMHMHTHTQAFKDKVEEPGLCFMDGLESVKVEACFCLLQS